MDCIVHGVAKSWTQLSDFHFHFRMVKKRAMSICFMCAFNESPLEGMLLCLCELNWLENIFCRENYLLPNWSWFEFWFCLLLLLNIGKLFSLFLGSSRNLMSPFNVYNSFFTEMLHRFCTVPQKYWQEKVDNPIISSICLRHKNHLINTQPLGWKYSFTFEIYELLSLMGLSSTWTCKIYLPYSEVKTTLQFPSFSPCCHISFQNGLQLMKYLSWSSTVFQQGQKEQHSR